jgi:hypothetical protein
LEGVGKMIEVYTKRISNLCAILSYLQSVRLSIGVDDYLKSFIRREHGVGSGFFNVSNTGSSDCGKEVIRTATDAMGFKFESIDKIYFRSQSVLNDSQHDRTKNTHRIEHTREIAGIIWPMLESKYVINNEEIDANEISEWLLINTIVTLIHPNEQKSEREYNDDLPMQKYSVPVYYQDKMVSKFSLKRLQAINKAQWASQIKQINKIDFEPMVKNSMNRYSATLPTKHRFCPLPLVEKYHNNDLALLENWYQHKLHKALDKTSKKYYNKVNADRYHDWKQTI